MLASEEVIEFGLHTNKNVNKEKQTFLEEQKENEIHVHYYSVNVKSKSGYFYNKIRAIRFLLK